MRARTCKKRITGKQPLSMYYLKCLQIEVSLSSDFAFLSQSTMVSKALSCITSRLDSIKDTYATALVTYTLMLAKHSDASKMMKLLRDKAVKKGNISNIKTKVT